MNFIELMSSYIRTHVNKYTKSLIKSNNGILGVFSR